MKFAASTLKESLLLLLCLTLLFFAGLYFTHEHFIFLFAFHYVALATAFIILLRPSSWQRSGHAAPHTSPWALFFNIAWLQVFWFMLMSTLPSIQNILPVPPATHTILLSSNMPAFQLLSGAMPWGIVACMGSLWANAVSTEQHWLTAATVLDKNGIHPSLAYSSGSIFEAHTTQAPAALMRIAMLALLGLAYQGLHMSLPLGVRFPVMLLAIMGAFLLQNTRFFKKLFQSIRQHCRFFTAYCLNTLIIALTLILLALFLGALNRAYGAPFALLAGNTTESIEHLLNRLVHALYIFPAPMMWLWLKALLNLSLTGALSLYVAQCARGHRMGTVIVATLALPCLMLAWLFLHPHTGIALPSNLPQHRLLPSVVLAVSAFVLMYLLVGTQRKASMLANTVLYAQDTTRSKSASRLLYQPAQNLIPIPIIYLYASTVGLMWAAIINSWMNISSYPLILWAALRKKTVKK